MVARYACRRRRALPRICRHLTPPAALRVATSRFTTVADDDVHRSMKDWPTCHLLQWQPSNVVANGSSRTVVSPAEGVGIGLCYLIGPPAQAGPTAVSITSSSSSATRRGQMILSGRGLSIQNDSGLAQGLAHHSAAGSGCGKLTGGKLGSPGEDPTKVTQLKWRSHTSFFVEAARTWMANISAFARVFRRAMSGHDGASDKD
jgi:hypothetical protein